MRTSYLFLIFTAVVAVAVADVFLKQASRPGVFSVVLKSPWFWGAIILYLYQVAAFTYVFVSGAKLTMVGIVQMVLYAVIVFVAGYFIFHERFGFVQYFGLVLALVGVFLLRFPR